MRLCAKHFLFAAVQMVPRRRPPAGQGAVCRDHGVRERETLCRMWRTFHAAEAQQPVLPGLCSEANAGKQKGMGAEKAGVHVEKVAFKIPVNTGSLNAGRRGGKVFIPFIPKTGFTFST